jgi:hypothetical protein
MIIRCSSTATLDDPREPALTTLARDGDGGELPRERRTYSELVDQQLHAISTFNAAQRLAREAATAAQRSREMRLDSSRRLEVLRRQQEALVARTAEHLRLSGELLPGTCAPRVVLAHRNDWFLDKVAQRLQEQQRCTIVARLDNGADAVGLAVAEQPDLLLVEDALPLVPGEQVVREVLHYCPHTVVAAQVAYSDRVAHLLAAGSAEVFVRSVPPADVAARLLQMV